MPTDINPLRFSGSSTTTTADATNGADTDYFQADGTVSQAALSRVAQKYNLNISSLSGNGDTNAPDNGGLTAPGSFSPGNFDSAISKLGGTGRSVADVFQVMQLIQEMSQTQRKLSREARLAERQEQASDLQAAADKMREAADMALAAGIVSGVFSIVQGGISIGSGAVGLKGLSGGKAAEETNLPVTDEEADVAPPKPGPIAPHSPPVGSSGSAPWSEAKTMSVGRLFDGSGTALKGVGDIIAAVENRNAENTRASEKESETSAMKHDTNAQSETDFMNGLRDLITDLQGKMQAIAQMNDDALRKAANV